MSEKQQSLWQRIALVAGGVVLVAATSAATIFGYDAWRKRDGWCMHGYPDGKQRILYGDDCKNLPNLGFVPQHQLPAIGARFEARRERVGVLPYSLG
jgi:hypothetical protein